MIKYKCKRLSIGEHHIVMYDRTIKAFNGIITFETEPSPAVAHVLARRGYLPLKTGENPYPGTSVNDDVARGEREQTPQATPVAPPGAPTSAPEGTPEGGDAAGEDDEEEEDDPSAPAPTDGTPRKKKKKKRGSK